MFRFVSGNPDTIFVHFTAEATRPSIRPMKKVLQYASENALKLTGIFYEDVLIDTLTEKKGGRLYPPDQL